MFVGSVWLAGHPQRVKGRSAPQTMRAGRRVTKRCLKRGQQIQQKYVGAWALGWAPAMLWRGIVYHPAVVHFQDTQPAQTSPDLTRTLRQTAQVAVSCCHPIGIESLSTERTPVLPGWGSHWIAGEEYEELSLHLIFSLQSLGPNLLY